MTVKTIRFNKNEERVLKSVLSHYGKDFSSCVKDLLTEKLEDLRDLDFIGKIREGAKKDYFTAGQITSIYNRA
ncbi:MAG: DUF6290 family protein [Candidatus Binatota bacterium]